MDTIPFDRHPSDRSSAHPTTHATPLRSRVASQPERRPTLLLTLTDVASHLRCTRRSVERQVAGGHLHVVHVGRAVRVERRELDRYLASLRSIDDAG